MGKCSGPKRKWGRVNHNQNILYERESIANRRRKRRRTGRRRRREEHEVVQVAWLRWQ